MKNRRSIATINASSMADIAFLLLIFFLVSTTIESDKGIKVMLPPFVPTPPTPLSDARVISIHINNVNQVLLEDDYISLNNLSDDLKRELQVRLNKDIQPVISYHVDRNTDYETYINTYNAIKQSYNELRAKKAEELYQTNIHKLSKAQLNDIKTLVPMVISEAEPKEH